MNVVRLQPYFLLALLGGALVLTFFILKPFLGPLILAAVFAVVFYPLYRWVLKIIGEKRRSIAALLVVVMCAACVLIPVSFLGTQVAVEAEQLYSSLAQGSGKAYLEKVLRFGDDLIMRYAPGTPGISATVSDNLDAYGKSALTGLIGYLGSFFSSVAVLALKLFIFFIALYYLLRDGVLLKHKIIALSPLGDTDDRAIFASLKNAVNSVVKGNLTIAVIQGTLTALGFIIFGVPNAALWGSVTAIAALIPGVGTALVLAPGVVYLLITGNTVAGVGLLVWGVFAVGLIDNLLGPKLIGRSSGLHPLLILVSVLGGIVLFGPLGIFLGPLSLSFLIALISIYSDSTQKYAE
jgi:predicted PurR-regulated permease PerM